MINRHYVLSGWRPPKADELEIKAVIWIEELDRRRIPWQTYMELFDAARAWILRSVQDTGKPPDLSLVDLMIASWPSVRQTQREAEIATGRTLPETAESDCPRCFGTGVEIIYTDAGEKLGARPGCKHEPLRPGEWLCAKYGEKKAA